MSLAKPEGSARERLLAAANELFYTEGVHSVGIDRVIERAGVAKASLYSSFGSKEELVRAYLAARAERRQQRINERLAREADPRAKILAVYDVLGELAAQPEYRGCAFVNASAETPHGENKVTAVCESSRGWLRALFTSLAHDAGAPDAPALAGQLVLLYDGAMISASMDHDPTATDRARATAATLLDVSLPKRQARRASTGGGRGRKGSPGRKSRSSV
ncbi:MAG TPA: TetR/AcrR family transcriptional regulator [Polyangiaceae bacterium]|nr:TetR/AcrR family transcriptional regulator [Polyangiaceae bacterium]